MNSFNKTEAAIFSCRLCFLRAFPFISFILICDKIPFMCKMGQGHNWHLSCSVWIGHSHNIVIWRLITILWLCPIHSFAELLTTQSKTPPSQAHKSRSWLYLEVKVRNVISTRVYFISGLEINGKKLYFLQWCTLCVRIVTSICIKSGVKPAIRGICHILWPISCFISFFAHSRYNTPQFITGKSVHYSHNRYHIYANIVLLLCTTKQEQYTIDKNMRGLCRVFPDIRSSGARTYITDTSQRINTRASASFVLNKWPLSRVTFTKIGQ